MLRTLRPHLGRVLLFASLGLASVHCRSTGSGPPDAPTSNAAPLAAAVPPPDAPPPVEEARAAPDGEEEDEDEEGIGGVEIALEEQRVTFDAAGRQSRRLRQIYRVLEPAAIEWWGSVSAEWSPWHERRPVLRASITNPGGRKFELDPRTIAESPAVEYSPDVYSDRRALRAPLPGVTVGSVVELEVETSEEQTFFPGGGGGGSFTFGSGAPVAESRLILDVPEGLRLAFARRGRAPEPKTTSSGGRRVLTFEARSLARLERGEALSPFDQPTIPEVVYGVGPSWAEIAARYAEIVEKQLEGADVSRWVREIVGNTRGRDPVIARLMARLHERIRYTGLELADAAIIPRRPAETLSRGYGDCKDKSVLLVAMLRAAGIEAHVALVQSGFGADVLESVPSPIAFNHAIVYVPGEPALWIDATFEYGRRGEIPLGVAGHRALIARRDSTGLTRIPETRSADNLYLESREVFLANYGPARFIEESEGRGSIEHDLRGRFAKMRDSELKKSFRDYAANAYLADGVTRVERFGSNDLDQRFRMRLTFERAKRGSTDPAESAVYLTAGGLLSWMPYYLMSDDPEPRPGVPLPMARRRARKNDLVFHQPYVGELRYRIVPPRGFALRHLPEDRELVLGPARFSERYQRAENGELRVTFRFDTGPARWSPANVAAFLEGLPQLQERLNRLVTFDHEGARLAKLGQVREALAIHGQLIAAEPKEAVHRARFATALVEAGFGEAARREAHAAVSLDPKSWFAQFTLGFVLGHDAFGRQDGRGVDHRGAIEAYKRAKALDPEDVNTRRNLAVSLEYGVDGRRYGRGARIDEAIAEYEALREDLKDESFDFSLIALLKRTGRAAELAAFAQDHPRSPLRNHALAYSTALLQGRAAMHRALDGLGLDAASRQTLISAVVNDLMMAREYALAREIAEEALPGSPNVVQDETRLAILKRLRRHESATAHPKSPDVFVLRWLAEMLASPNPSEVTARYSSAALLEETKRAIARQPKLSTLIVPITRTSMPMRAMDPVLLADMATSLVTTRVEGTDDVGYRVVLHEASSNTHETYFVLREGGAFKLRASLQTVDALGAQALALGERGDWAGAKVWLDWARDAVESPGGEDPLRGNAFARVWSHGQEATPERVRLAAAVLAAPGSGASDAAAGTLKSLRASASEEQHPAIDQALVHAGMVRNQPKQVVESGERLLTRYPKSEIAFDLLAHALLRAGRGDEVLRKVEARLAAAPEDRAAMDWAARVAGDRGDFAKRMELEKRIIAIGKATPTTYNNLAWDALFLGSSLEEATEHAVRAVNMTRGASLSVLHTLATLYAERGKTAEATSILRKLLESRDGEPSSEDWYIIGRIAETYELFDVARAAYEKVSQSDLRPDSTGVLARRRLDGLARHALRRP